MKKLLLPLCIALATQTALAEDVTSTYLSNPGFEDCTAEASNVSTAIDYTSNGWTVATSGSGYQFGGVLVYGSSLVVNNASYGTVPTAGPESNTGTNNNTLGISVGWDNSVTYTSSEFTLPAGIYTISASTYNTNSATSFSSSSFGFKASSGTTYYTSKTTFTQGDWETTSVTFMLEESTTGSIVIYAAAASATSTSYPILYFDDITIETVDIEDVTESYLTDPGFEALSALSEYTTDAGISSTSDNWTGTYSGTATGAAVKYNSSLYVGVSGCTVPESSWNSDVSNEVALGLNARWGTGNYAYFTSEEITLPAGTYMIAVHAYNANSSATAVGANYTGFITQSNTTYYSTNTSFAYGAWTTDLVSFTLDEATTGQVRVGYAGASGGAGSNPVLYVDDVTIYGPEPATDDEEETTSYDISDYVVANGGFEECTAITENLCNSGTQYVDYAEQGWTASHGDNTYAGVVEYGSSYTVNDASAPSTAWNADEEGVENNNTLAISSGWSGSIYYDGDTITLPAGNYVATIHSYNANSSATAWQSNLTGFVALNGATYYASRLNFTSGSWQTCTVSFTLEEATTGFFRVGGQGVNSGSSSNAIVFFDDYTVTTDVEAAMGYQTVETAIDGLSLSSITVSYRNGWNTSEDASLSLASGSTATVTGASGEEAATATLSELADGTGFTATFSKTLTTGTTYTITIPAGVYGYSTEVANEAISEQVTIATPCSLGEATASVADGAIINFGGTLTVSYASAEDTSDGLYTAGVQNGASATLTAGEESVASGTIAALDDGTGFTVSFNDLSLTTGTTYTLSVAAGAYGYTSTKDGYASVLSEAISISFTEAIQVAGGQLYTLKQKASGLYMSVEESMSQKYNNIKLSEEAYGFQLVQVEDKDSLQLVSESGEYIYHNGIHSWTIGTSTNGNGQYGDGDLNIALVGTEVDTDGTILYQLVRNYSGSEYILSTDAGTTDSGSTIYDDKSYSSVGECGLWAIEEFTRENVSVSVGTTGYSTLYYSQYNLSVPEGLTAYTVTVDGSYAILTAIESSVIPAGTGVVLKADDTLTEDTSYTFSVSSEDAAAIEDNNLVGSDYTTKIAEDGYVYYILSTSSDDETVGFYYQSGTSGAYVTNTGHKASLAVKAEDSSDDEESTEVKSLTIVFSDATGILSTPTSETQAVKGIYTIAGQKLGTDVNSLQPGLYIINGKKTLVK